MKFLSVCSGIEAASVAWKPLGWRAHAFSEIEKFPSQVLAHHYPDVPNLGDMTRYQEWPDAAIDLLVGGTPCQSFSVAGLRKGLGDPRGNLMLTYGAIAGRYRPRWLVWENVPGVLSSNGGRDFGTFLGMLAELGYGFAYRILDAQYIRVDGFARAVPQRRRRVFVVGHFGDWRRAAAVLFERESLCGHPAPRRQAREGIAGTVARSLAIRGRDGTPQAELGEDVANAVLTPSGGRAGIGVGAVLQSWPAEVASTLNAHYGDKQGLEDQHALGGGSCLSLPSVSLCLNAGAMGRLDAESETLIPAIGGGFDVLPFDTTQITSPANRSHPKFGNACHSLAAGAHPPTIAFDCKASGQNGFGIGEIASTMRAMGHAGSHTNGGGHQAVMDRYGVRRLMPVECERLQGFPDGYTDIRPSGKATPDGPRYKACGNSMAIPPMRWIGRRIQLVESINSAHAAEAA
jgi:DNA (cytosine-5)-methyltransferase 1